MAHAPEGHVLIHFFTYMLRTKNQFADAPATLASMLKTPNDTPLQTIDIDRRDDPAYFLNVEEELDGNPWYHDVKMFYKEETYPSRASAVDRRTTTRACQFFLGGVVFYKRSYGNALLRCFDAREANKIMSDVHEGACGWTDISRQLLMGYYWSTMRKRLLQGYEKNDIYARCMPMKFINRWFHCTIFPVLSPPMFGGCT